MHKFGETANHKAFNLNNSFMQNVGRSMTKIITTNLFKLPIFDHVLSGTINCTFLSKNCIHHEIRHMN